MLEAGNLLLLAAIISNVIVIALCIKGKSRSKWFMVLGTMAVTGAALRLVHAQILHDFSYRYVFEHTSLNLQFPYTISALWAGEAGSLLTWVMLSSIICLLLFWPQHSIAAARKAFPWLAGINLILTCLVLTNHPFARLSGTEANGQGMTAALQNPWMAVHPPLIFAAYGACAVLFALAAGNKHMPDKIMRQWTARAWFLLTAGILTGSRWAYVALGWGGFWAWDPLENAALVPWLLLMARWHDYRNSRSSYMLPFVLAVLSTYLARSGLLQGKSLHAYAGAASGWLLPVMLIGTAGLVLIIQYITGRSLKDSFNRQDLFVCITDGFAWLLLAATLAPLLTGLSVAPAVFNYGAIVYVLLLSCLMLERQSMMYLYVSIPLTTALLVILALLFSWYQWGWLLLLGIILVTLINGGFSNKKLEQYFPRLLAHCGIIILIIGVIAGGGLSQQGAVMNDGQGYRINGDYYRSSPVEEVTLLSKFKQDVLITPLSSSNLLWASYTIRPLIIGYWIGGALLMAGMLALIIKPGLYPRLDEYPVAVNHEVP